VALAKDVIKHPAANARTLNYLAI